MVRAGSILFSSGQGVSIDPTKYSHFEFYAKAETEDVFLTGTSNKIIHIYIFSYP